MGGGALHPTNEKLSGQRTVVRANIIATSISKLRLIACPPAPSPARRGRETDKGSAFYAGAVRQKSVCRLFALKLSLRGLKEEVRDSFKAFFDSRCSSNVKKLSLFPF